MPSAVVSVTTGVLKPLLGKLTELLGDEYKQLTGVRKQAAFLRDELSAMKALLDKMELMDKLDPSAKNWRDYVREMSYDMANCIDGFMCDIQGADSESGFDKNMAKHFKRLRKHHQIASRIEELKVLAVGANASPCETYKIDDGINSSHGVVVVDPRISAIYMEMEGLVGIDGPREELVSLLTGPQKELKVVSIVGSGGLGKSLPRKCMMRLKGSLTVRHLFLSPKDLMWKAFSVAYYPILGYGSFLVLLSCTKSLTALGNVSNIIGISF